MDDNALAVRTLNTNVSRLTGAILGVKGVQYGLELELEGRNVRMEGVAVKGWKREADGSLRGESIEFVFAGPAEYNESIARVQRLFEAFDKNGVKLKNSYRTSTHVHINFSDRKFRDVVNFFVAYTILEELFEQYCGEGREGNLFCLPSRDVEGVVKMLENAVTAYGNLRDFHNEVRYCALNLCALSKFGTLEIRTMRGADNAKQVIDWIDILKQLDNFCSNKMETPVKLVESLSLLGMDGFLHQIFDPATVRKLLASWPADRPLAYSLMEGARLVQVLAYRLDEAYRSPFVEPKEKPPQPVRKPQQGDVRGRYLNDIPHQRVRTHPGAHWYIPNSRPIHMERMTGAEEFHWDEDREVWVESHTGLILEWRYLNPDVVGVARVWAGPERGARHMLVETHKAIGEFSGNLQNTGAGIWVHQMDGRIFRTLDAWDRAEGRINDDEPDAAEDDPDLDDWEPEDDIDLEL